MDDTTTITALESLIEIAEVALLGVKREWERLYGPAEMEWVREARENLGTLQTIIDGEYEGI